MTLVADNQLIKVESKHHSELRVAISRWTYSSPSTLLHHGKTCCSIAREWLFATDKSQLNGHDQLMGPRWLRRRYEWGPSQWPMTWCYAVEQKFLDCGALAALSREVFAARGVTCYAAQLIQRYTEQTTDHWFSEWTDHPASTHWIQGALIYHEACAVEIAPNEIRIWDPSAGWWANPKQNGGYSSILALRVVTSPGNQVTSLNWGEHEIGPDVWQTVQTRDRFGKREPDSFADDGSLEPATLAAILTNADLQPLEEIEGYQVT